MKACALKQGHSLGHIWIERNSAPLLGDCLAKKPYAGFRLIDGTVDNSKCPHLHLVDDNNELHCQTCGQAWKSIRRNR